MAPPANDDLKEEQTACETNENRYSSSVQQNSDQQPEDDLELANDDNPDNQQLDNDYHEEELSDIPMDTADHGSSLPSAEELRTDAAAASYDNGRVSPGMNAFCILMSTIVMLALIIGLSVGLSQKNSPRNPAYSMDPNNGNNGRPLVPRNSNMRQVVDFLVDAGVTDRATLEASNSNQFRAASWMAELDDRNLPVPPEHTLETDDGYRYAARYIMTLLWFAMEGSTWDVQLGFLLELDICLWNTIVPYRLVSGKVSYFRVGVYCDGQGLPVELLLDYNNLKGTLPKEIAKLDTLMIMDFDGNAIRGQFYPQLCSLSNLVYLGFSHNQMAGSLPSCLTKMTQLKALLLSNNEFVEEVPNLAPLSSLRVLYLDDNRLSGDISVMFNNMKNITYLYADSNYFQAFVDENFLAGLNRLQRLDMSDCSVMGKFPNHLLELPNISVIDLHNNRMTGPMPISINNNDHLLFLALHENELSGSIPATIANLRNLFHLDLSSNQFNGTIPEEIGFMTDLTYLFMAQNPFTPGPIPTDFRMLTNLGELGLKDTALTGVLPPFLSELTSLVLLDLDNNGFIGTLPASYGNLTNLEFLLLNRNPGVNGTIPSSLSALKRLRAGYFDMTDMKGNFSVLCALPNFSSDKTVGGTGTIKQFGDEKLSANCGGAFPQVNCKCCEICCASDEKNCNQNQLVASLNPQWEYAYDRVEYEFNKENGSAFRDTDYIPYQG